MEFEIRVVAPVDGAERTCNLDARRFAVDDDQRRTLSLDIHQDVDEVGARAAGDIGFLAIDDQCIAVESGPGRPFDIIRLGEAERGALFAGEQGHQVAAAQRLADSREHPGTRTEDAGQVADVVGTEGVPNRRQCQQRGPAAELRRLDHGIDPGCLRRGADFRRTIDAVQRAIVAQRNEDLPRQALRTVAQRGGFGRKLVGHGSAQSSVGRTTSTTSTNSRPAISISA